MKENEEYHGALLRQRDLYTYNYLMKIFGVGSFPYLFVQVKQVRVLKKVLGHLPRIEVVRVRAVSSFPSCIKEELFAV